MDNGLVIGGAIVVVLVVAGIYFLTSAPGSGSVQQSTSIKSTIQTTVQTTTLNAQPAAPMKLKIGFNAIVGNYITTSTGWSLYMFVNDTQNSGTSSCYGGCAKYWPAFYSASLTTSAGINESKITVINRTDGTKQDAYNGYPLYYFAKDVQPGDVAGQDSKGTWFVVSPSGNIIIMHNLTASTTTIISTTSASTTSTLGCPPYCGGGGSGGGGGGGGWG